MKKTRVAINGLGRIGRAFVRQTWDNKFIELVAVNDLGSLENLAYLLKYDTVYGPAPFPVEVEGDKLMISKKGVTFLSEKDPALLPWADLKIDVVIESTGFFTEYEKAQAHITAGAKHVVISAPAKGDANLGRTALVGVNPQDIKTCAISSNASCTTNASSPVIAILDETLGIEHAILSTTHAYTASQSIVDGPSKKDHREGRAAAQNIIPTSTGAAIAVTKAYPSLEGKFDGISLRVPVPAGSIADITFVTKRDTSAEEVNQILKDAALSKRWDGILATSEEELVSSDIVGSRTASIIDLPMTRVVNKRLVKVLAWYDNEMGYTSTLVRHVLEAGN